MTWVKSFFYDTEPLMLPVGTVLVHNGGTWGLYHNNIEKWTLLLTRGRESLTGREGWRARQLSGLLTPKDGLHAVRNFSPCCLKDDE